MSPSSSAPRSDARTELETVVNWPMLVGAAALALLLLAVPLVLACLAALRGAAVKEPVALPQPPPRPQPVPAASRTRSAQPLAHPDLEAKPMPRPIYVEVARPPLPPESPRRAIAVKTPKLDPVLDFVEVKQPLFRRFNESSEDELAEHLDDHAKDVDLDTMKETREKLLEPARKIAHTRPAAAGPSKVEGKDESSILVLSKKRADLRGLPMREGAACQLGEETAKKWPRVVKEIRTLRARMRQPTFGRGYLDLSPRAIEEAKWIDADTMSTVVQIFQVEDATLRESLVKRLATTSGKKASAMLARCALFDLSSRVRQEAVKALKDRPATEYRQAMLEGLRYPWAPVAAHAAEALVELEDYSAIVPLIDLLDEPDPCEPTHTKDDKWVVRELVRVNHLRNCLLCHPPSLNRTDPMRGVVPTPGQPLPRVYYESRTGDFVRADVIHLQQDFSCMQRVDKPDKWPSFQRFDYLIRTRELTADEVAAHKKKTPRPDCSNYPQREAVLFALRELTGLSLGYKSADWQELLWWWDPTAAD